MTDKGPFGRRDHGSRHRWTEATGHGPGQVGIPGAAVSSSLYPRFRHPLPIKLQGPLSPSQPTHHKNKPYYMSKQGQKAQLFEQKRHGYGTPRLCSPSLLIPLIYLKIIPAHSCLTLRWTSPPLFPILCHHQGKSICITRTVPVVTLDKPYPRFENQGFAVLILCWTSLIQRGSRAEIKKRIPYGGHNKLLLCYDYFHIRIRIGFDYAAIFSRLSEFCRWQGQDNENTESKG